MSNELYVNTILNEYVLFVLCFECTDIIGADCSPACQVVQRSMILYCVISPPFITLTYKHTSIAQEKKNPGKF